MYGLDNIYSQFHQGFLAIKMNVHHNNSVKQVRNFVTTTDV